MPVTISGFWYSSPIRFQYAVFANSRSYGSRSFSSLMSCGSGSVCAGACAIAGVAPDVDIVRRVAAGVPWLWSWAMSMSGRMSASITFSDDFVRSWLRSRRTVSWFASTSSLPPATKPATSTRWNGETSSFGWIGVSIGISK